MIWLVPHSVQDRSALIQNTKSRGNEHLLVSRYSVFAVLDVSEMSVMDML
jgi:hypothetical protein